MSVGVLGLCLAASTEVRGAEEIDVQDTRPNFLIILADDLGFSDLGFMGSEIRTPNLDRLASTGLVMSNFYVTPACSPTRAALLTGTDTHPAGLGTMAGEVSAEQRGLPGYEGFLSDRVVTVATLLRDAGYHTYLSGKWHLGVEAGQQPMDRGFEHAFGLLRGGATHFSDQLALFADGPPPRSLFLDDGTPLEQLPDGWFSTDGYTDRLITHLESDRESGKPFFAVAAFTAPHWPLQAPEAFIDRYSGDYDDGWDKLRARRVKALQALKPLQLKDITSDRLPWVPAWDSLSPESQRHESRAMEVYAAMVENLDHNVGRLLEHLELSGQLGNTVVFFSSDNGAEGNPVNRILDDEHWVENHFDNRLENIGRPGSYRFTGPGWAQASTAPFSLFKSFTSEGGIRTPAVIAGPGFSQNTWSDEFATIKDIAPSFLELASVPQPGASYQGRAITPMTGRSLVRVWQEEPLADAVPATPMVWELFGRRAVRDGPWKARWLYPPYGAGQWELFNLDTDPTEAHNLAQREPEVLQRLLRHWNAYRDDHNVALPASDGGYALEPVWQ